MYCPGCGTVVNESLRYCNYCGARLSKLDDQKAQKTLIGLLLPAICVLTLGGLGILVALVGVLLRFGVTPSTVGVVAVFYLAALAAICYALLTEYPKLIGANLTKNTAKNEPAQPVMLSAPTTAQLEEHREPASVTEHTTRTLDKIGSKT